MVKVLSMNKDKYNFNPRLDLRQISGIAIIIAAMVLISMQVHRTKPLKVADPVEQLQTDRNTANLMGLSGAQLIPGLSVGRIRLGESAEFLRSLLGKPQLGDAAMCKSWERWEWGGGQQVLEIFESCDAKQDMKKTVQQIRFSGLSFGTREGIFLKSTFAKIRQQFPDLTAAAVFTDKSTGRTMFTRIPPTSSPASRASAMPSRHSCTGISSSRATKCTTVSGERMTSMTRSAWSRTGPTRASPETSAVTFRNRVTRPVGGASSTTAS